MPVTRLEKLLKSGSGSGLADVVQRARDMQDLTSALRAALPPDLADNLVCANLRDGGELALVCSSPAWAARLRFETERLAEVARRRGSEVNTCRVTVSQGV